MIPTTGLTLATVAQMLRGMRGFLDTADVYGPRKAGRIVSFLKLYPYFEIQGSGPNIKVFVAKAPEPRPRPVQASMGGGASSSTDQDPRERQPRSIEIDPRAPYRRFPNEQRVEYGANPARVNTPRY